MPLSDALGQGRPGWKKAWLPELERPGWDPTTAGPLGGRPGVEPSPAGPYLTGLDALNLGRVPMGAPDVLGGAGPTVAPPTLGGAPARGGLAAGGADPGFLALLARLLQGLSGGAGRTGRSFLDETGGGGR